MTNLRIIHTTFVVIVIAVLLGLSNSFPQPGGHGGKHTHFIIKVPHYIHTHHHTHTKKIYIPVKSHGGGGGHHDHSGYKAAHDTW